MPRRLLIALLGALLLVPGLGLPVAAPAAGAATADSVRFTAAGDFGTGAGAKGTFATMGRLGRDFSLALGDLSYSSTTTESQWCDLVKAGVGATYPFELVSGNHDAVGGGGGLIDNFAACLPNRLPGLTGEYGRQFVVDVPQASPLVRIIEASPNIQFPQGWYEYPKGSARYAWVAAAIDEARSRGIPWVVVAMHKPCISVSAKSCEPGPDLMNLLVAKKVDLVLAGHAHTYERTAQLAHSGACPSLVPVTYAAGCVAARGSRLTKGAGTVFLTVGTGGVGSVPVNPSDAEAPYFEAMSGSNLDPAYGVADVAVTATSLTSTFVPSDGRTFADTVTITASAANRPPTAAFTQTCTSAVCSFDASGSLDRDGRIAAYRWSFGDGTTATGATTKHRYEGTGTRTVTLTVTDDAGATSSLQRSLSWTGPTPTALVRDGFARTLASGWGQSPVGGVWRASGAVPTRVDGTHGVITPRPGVSGSEAPAAPAALVANLRTYLTTATRPTGTGLAAVLAPRVVAGVGEYRATSRVTPTGAVTLTLWRQVGSASTALRGPVVVPGLTVLPGEHLGVRVDARTAWPTLLCARAWKTTATEPTSWTVCATDATSTLQAPGTLRLTDSVSPTSTAPLAVRHDAVFAYRH